jgi:hypothetical protein
MATEVTGGWWATLGERHVDDSVDEIAKEIAEVARA